MKIHPAIKDIIPTDGLDILCPFCNAVCVYTQADNDHRTTNPHCSIQGPYWGGFACHCNHYFNLTTDVTRKVPRRREELVLDSLHFSLQHGRIIFIQFTNNTTEFQLLPVQESVYKTIVKKDHAIVPDFKDLSNFKNMFSTYVVFS